MYGSQFIRTFILGFYIIIFLAIVNSCQRESFSPDQAESFIKFFGSYKKDKGFDIKSLNDGGYVLVGTSETENAGTNIMIIRTDKYGNEIGDNQQVGGLYDDHVHSVIVPSSGGFAILGSTTVETDDLTLVSNMYLIRTNNLGDVIWTKIFNQNSNEIGYSLAETSENGFILIGSTENHDTGKTNIRLIKTNSVGDVVWTRTHGGINDDIGLHIAETKTGYIYTGYTRNWSKSDQPNSDIFVVKTNAIGVVIYPSTFGTNGDDYGKTIIPHPEGGFLVLGTTSNPSSKVKNIFLAHIDEENISETLWTRSIGGSVSHVAACMKILPDGGIIITGTQELAEDNHTIFLLKTDSNGNEVFLKTFGGLGHQRAEAVDLAIDGGFVITGSNELGGNSMITLIKTKANGEL